LDTNNIAISMIIMLMHHEILGQIQPMQMSSTSRTNQIDPGLSVLDKQTANNIKQPYIGLF